MKIPDHFPGTAQVYSITSVASKIIDLKIPKDLSALYHFLSPQWFAGFAGLKKLVEKDYLDPGEQVCFSPTF